MVNPFVSASKLSLDKRLIWIVYSFLVTLSSPVTVTLMVLSPTFKFWVLFPSSPIFTVLNGSDTVAVTLTLVLLAVTSASVKSFFSGSFTGSKPGTATPSTSNALKFTFFDGALRMISNG